eukprot:1866743-Heterocapsa_arctica.AAC.1
MAVRSPSWKGRREQPLEQYGRWWCKKPGFGTKTETWGLGSRWKDPNWGIGCAQCRRRAARGAVRQAWARQPGRSGPREAVGPGRSPGTRQEEAQAK